MRAWRERAALAVAAGVTIVLTGCGSAADVASADRPSTTAPTEPTGIVDPSDPTTPSTPTAPSIPTGSPDLIDDPPVIPADSELAMGESDPVEDPLYPQQSNPEIDVLHYFLQLDWDGDTLLGTETVTFRATKDTDRIRLDLSSELGVQVVRLDGEPVDFTHENDGLVVLTPPVVADQRHELQIEYVGTPAPTPAPSQRSDPGEGLGWTQDLEGNVYTFQEPYGAFTWYAVNDHPSDEALYDARIVTYGDDVSVFNGVLRESVRIEGDRTVNSWHVDEPMASYLSTIAIGPYSEYVGSTDSGMDISYWVMPQDEDLVDGLKTEGAASFDWLEEHAGDYPFSSLGVVVVGGSSAMETQTMVTMSRGAVERPDAVLEHEFAHQWYGDAVTPVDWRGVWLNEGFAMYFQQWYERDTGRTMYGNSFETWRQVDNLSRQSAGPPGDYDPAAFADSNVYLGPALMLNEIRERIGDPEFEQLVKTWVTDHDNEQVDREVFTQYVNQQTGRNFTALIDSWLDSPTTPRIN